MTELSGMVKCLAAKVEPYYENLPRGAQSTPEALDLDFQLQNMRAVRVHASGSQRAL